MAEGAAPEHEDAPQWVDGLVTALHEQAGPQDRHRQLREWIGLAIAGLLTYLLATGVASIEAIQLQVDRTEVVSIATKDALDRHIRSANEANMALAAILRTIEGRTARLEGIEEQRNHGGDHR